MLNTPDLHESEKRLSVYLYDELLYSIYKYSWYLHVLGLYVCAGTLTE